MAEGGPSSMDIDRSILQNTSLTSSTPGDFNRRPHFLRHEKLKEIYGCALCKDVLVQPHQTPCGQRVCKKCIEDRFGDELNITCPLPHDDMEDEEEPCQREGGLRRTEINPDSAIHRQLLKEKCFCSNKEFGCCEYPQWKKLHEHELNCNYVPEQCKNLGCSRRVSKFDMEGHLKECGYAMVECRFCKTKMKRLVIEDHVNDCEFADSECSQCRKKFNKRKQLTVHQRTHKDCITVPGRCYYYEYCGFETDSLQRLKDHLEDTKAEHMEYLTVKVAEMEQSSNKAKQLYNSDVKSSVVKKVKPLEKVTAEIAMNVKRISEKIGNSETNADNLLNAMRTVQHSSQQIETLTNKVGVIERQIKDSGLDRVTVIESHSQNIRRHNDAITEMEKRMKNVELASYDGTLIWKITDYKRRKADAVRGRQMSIYSHPFYSARFGYKMCCRAYLNGDGLGRGKCLSLFFVLMRGEYDELLQFPFKQRVTFSLICPTNPALSKHETFMPDPESSSFRRPQTEMNIASGCPQFALQSDVESSTFLINDTIYIRCRVEAGGDTIP